MQEQTTPPEEVTEETVATEEVPVEAVPAKPLNFFRQHTFKVKGPNRRETRDYLRSRGIVLHHPEGREPLTALQIEKYFREERQRRFPEQYIANLAVLQKNLDKLQRRIKRKHEEAHQHGATHGKIPVVTSDAKQEFEVTTATI